MRTLQLGGDGRRCVGNSEIGNDGMRVDPMTLLQRRGQLVKAIAAAPSTRARNPFGEQFRKRFADAGRGAGDQCRLALAPVHLWVSWINLPEDFVCN